MNGDRQVNAVDVAVVSAHWGGSGPAGDANGDGTVNVLDINWISARWIDATSSTVSAGQLRQAPLAAEDQTAAITGTALIESAADNRSAKLISARTPREHAHRTIRAVDAVFDDADFDVVDRAELEEIALALGLIE